MMRAILVGSILLLAVPAQAQTTTCGWELGKWVCRQRPGVNFQAFDPYASMREGQEFADRLIENQRRRQNEDAQIRDAHTQAVAQARQRQEAGEAAQARRLIGKATADGHCDLAKQAALELGDFDLAEQVGRLCVPR